MKHSLVSLAAAASLALGVADAAQAAPGWDGVYTYTYDGGETHGGSPILIKHRLVLAGRTCAITVQGFQVDESYRCTASARGGGLEVAYVSHGDGSLTNAYGVAIYKPGERLFTLRRAGRRVLTQWGRMAPQEEMPTRAGAYFKAGEKG